MSSVLQPHQQLDYLNYCDNECKNIITPYINGIQRILFQQHNNNIYYQIPFVIQSICSSYYCHHIEYRLSLKTLFTQFPTYDHFLSTYHNPHCKYNFKSCPSIIRIQSILNNFDSYLYSNLWSTESLSPYITYKYYNIKQIISDINHIRDTHPENMVKFYISNTHKTTCNNTCNHINHYNNINIHNDINDIEEWIKYNILQIHNEFIHHNNIKQQFITAISHIITYNENVFRLLNTLRNVSRKLMLADNKYKILDTTNPLVQQKLMGFEGVLHFLSLLGFESNITATKLICKYPPPMHIIHEAISVIDTYKPERRPSYDPPNINIPPINPIISNFIHGNFNYNNMNNMQNITGPLPIPPIKHFHIEDKKEREHVTVEMMNTMMNVNPLSMSEHQLCDTIYTRNRSLKLRLSRTEFVDINTQIANESNYNGKNSIFGWFGNKFKLKKKKN
eukprot:400621_1